MADSYKDRRNVDRFERAAKKNIKARRTQFDRWEDDDEDDDFRTTERIASDLADTDDGLGPA